MIFDVIGTNILPELLGHSYHKRSSFVIPPESTENGSKDFVQILNGRSRVHFCFFLLVDMPPNTFKYASSIHH